MPVNFKVALILAFASIKRSSLLTNLLVTFVLCLTYVNLMFGRGVLTGLPEGATLGYRNNYTGDVLITNLESESYIKDPIKILKILDSSRYVKGYSARYVTSMFITGDYKKAESDKVKIFAEVVGLNPEQEARYYGLNKFLIAGNYFKTKGAVLGSSLLQQYMVTEGLGDSALNSQKVGDTIEIINGSNTLRTEITGVTQSKVRNLERRVYLDLTDYKKLVHIEPDSSLKEIAIKLENGVSPESFKKVLQDKGITSQAQVKTYIEGQPQFINDIKVTFSILGNLIGGVGLVIACITVFIIVYISAINRRREIGILKGIGISSVAIETAFVIQACFYAIVGAGFGLIIVKFGLVPYFENNPINFPFAEGVLLAPNKELATRFLILVVASCISGYIPAYLITKQKAINAILQR